MQSFKQLKNALIIINHFTSNITTGVDLHENTSHTKMKELKEVVTQTHLGKTENESR